MSKNGKKKNEDIVAEEKEIKEELDLETAPEEGKEPPEEDAKTEGPEILDPELVKAQTTIEKQQKDLAELQDKYMRLYAEFDNFRKRSTNELQNAKAKGVDSALHSFFPCMDSIDRAIAMCKEETQLAGFKLIQKQFENALYTIGVKAIDPLGEEFNPEYHNAVLKEVDPDNAGKIIQVLQKGYIYKDSLLRPAMVKIASDE